MRGENGCGGTVKKSVIRRLESIAIGLRRKRPLMASRGRRRLRRHPAFWLAGTDSLAALAQAWSVTTIAVIVLCVTVSLAPMWDRAIFLKSLLDALNTDPEMLQLAYPVPDDAPASLASRAPRRAGDSDG
jgi:hypothetical protein